MPPDRDPPRRGTRRRRDAHQGGDRGGRAVQAHPQGPALVRRPALPRRTAARPLPPAARRPGARHPHRRHRLGRRQAARDRLRLPGGALGPQPQVQPGDRGVARAALAAAHPDAHPPGAGPRGHPRSARAGLQLRLVRLQRRGEHVAAALARRRAQRGLGRAPPHAAPSVRAGRHDVAGRDRVLEPGRAGHGPAARLLDRPSRAAGRAQAEARLVGQAGLDLRPGAAGRAPAQQGRADRRDARRRAPRTEDLPARPSGHQGPRQAGRPPHRRRLHPVGRRHRGQGRAGRARAAAGEGRAAALGRAQGRPGGLRHAGRPGGDPHAGGRPRDHRARRPP